ncbi:MAG: GTPase HflX [Clostridia bacterium]|nr:GTPase HflX [Oscillospiraceae bacterium]MBQ6836933.1 GTPase HflX [Clostridia bacterium]MBQ6933356.1 GTPase HflX [Clostridia bacterium]
MNEIIEKKVEKAILVGINCGALKDFENSDRETLDELSELLETAGGETAAILLQNRKAPDPHTFIGEGKAEELKALIEAHEANLVVFDNEITPSQTRAIEEITKCRVIDRNALILDIFADRAKTREGILQVELAQYKYLLPRLSGMWGHLVRQTASGGKSPIGTRGPGETQLETDRRHIRQIIQKLEGEIEHVKQIRTTQRKKREKSEIPQVAIVGYTNAGKSTLLNALTGAGVHANNRLFDTLDPTTKSMRLYDNSEVFISDTVGFIRKLPHQLVDAFKATLEELMYADVLVHVIDASNENWEMQENVVEKLIAELGAQETPRIVVFNKIDKIPFNMMPRRTGAIYASALNKIGLDDLLQAIIDTLNANKREATFLIPYSDGGVVDILHRDAKVRSTEFLGEGVKVVAVVDAKIWGRYKKYSEDKDETVSEDSLW